MYAEKKIVTKGRIRGREGAEMPLLPIRTRRSCTGNCKEVEGDSVDEKDEEPAAARRVVRSELSEGIVDAETETAICALCTGKQIFPRKSEKKRKISVCLAVRKMGNEEMNKNRK